MESTEEVFRGNIKGCWAINNVDYNKFDFIGLTNYNDVICYENGYDEISISHNLLQNNDRVTIVYNTNKLLFSEFKTEDVKINQNNVLNRDMLCVLFSPIINGKIAHNSSFWVLVYDLNKNREECEYIIKNISKIAENKPYIFMTNNVIPNMLDDTMDRKITGKLFISNKYKWNVTKIKICDHGVAFEITGLDQLYGNFLLDDVDF